jgi:dienelactone hydrolase
MKEITFRIDGTDVAADLYLPPDLEPAERRPGLVVGHGFGFIKEGLVPSAEYFSKAGYVVLAIDYRSFGRSGGEVRGELFPQKMVEDFRGGITYLETRQEVQPDRIGLWGTSFGGALVIATAARDRRVKATVAQVPIVNGKEWMEWLRTPEQWEHLLDELDADRRRRFAGEPSKRIPIALEFSSSAVSGMPTDAGTLSFMKLLDTMVKTWRPDIALESLERVIEFNPSAEIAKIGPRPLCIVANTGYEAIHPMGQILDAYAAAREPKSLVLLPVDQLGLYAEPGQSTGFKAALDFLAIHLPVHGTTGADIPRTKFD